VIRDRFDKEYAWSYLDSRETEYLIEYAYEVPIGLSFNDLEKQGDAIAASVGVEVDLINRGGAVVISIPKKDFPIEIKYKKEYLELTKGNDVLLGFDKNMTPIKHSFKVPHLMIGGMSGYGKTDLIRWIVFQLISRFTPEQLQIQIIDMKGFSFLPFRNIPHITRIARDLPSALSALKTGYRLMNERSNQVWEDGNRKKVKSFKWHIVLIDEASQIAPELIRDRGLKALASKCDSYAAAISCIGREAKVGLIYCTQRPDSTIINPQVKANMDASICFKTKTSSNSKIILDRDGAEKLPCGIAGRAIYSSDEMTTFQVPYIGDDEAWEKLLKPYHQEVIVHDKEGTEEEEHLIIIESDAFNFNKTSRNVLSWNGFPSKASIRDISRDGKSKSDRR
jgi:S-DNA-T family DNA segregation ATPase FtsK/SpoIIIE